MRQLDSDSCVDRFCNPSSDRVRPTLFRMYLMSRSARAPFNFYHHMRDDRYFQQFSLLRIIEVYRCCRCSLTLYTESCGLHIAHSIDNVLVQVIIAFFPVFGTTR